MKNLIQIGAVLMAISLPTLAKTTKTNFTGRVIEFKSGPEGFDTRTFFYEGTNEVVAFDAQFTPALAKQSIEHLRKFTQKPISWLVITHPNPDKFNGASEFKKEGAKIIGSVSTAEATPSVHSYKEYFFVEMAKMFKKGEYPQPVSYDQTFSKKMDLVLQGGERIKLQELSQPGISSTQTVAYINSVKSLMVGDLIHHKAHAWLEGGIVNNKATPNIEGWIADLKEVAAIFPKDTQVYGGRGATAKLSLACKDQINYLIKAQSIVKTELKALGSKAKDAMGSESTKFSKALTEKFKTEFPDYELAYMIEYGSYGLVQDEIAKLK